MTAALVGQVPASAARPADLIVFSRTVGVRQELYSIRPDGSGLRRLALAGGEPTLSPDGRLIASFAGEGIAVRTRAGRLVRQIRVHRSGLTDLSWSPGGRWLAFLAERCQTDGRGDQSPLCADLWLVRSDGRARRRLLEANVYTNTLGTAYGWAPSGRSIVFERYQRRGLAVVDVRTASVRTLRGTVRFGSSDPAWAPGWIVFARQRGPFRGSDLYAVRPGGARLHKICRAENAHRPVPSPDGRTIAFLDYRPTGGENRWHVRVVSLAGGRCRDVGTATEEWTLAWSPDGTRLVWENFIERLVVGWVDRRAPPKTLARGSFADWG